MIRGMFYDKGIPGVHYIWHAVRTAHRYVDAIHEVLQDKTIILGNEVEVISEDLDVDDPHDNEDEETVDWPSTAIGAGLGFSIAVATAENAPLIGALLIIAQTVLGLYDALSNTGS